MPPEPPAFVANAVVATRRAPRRGGDRLLPADLAVFDSSIGIGSTQLLGTFAELRLSATCCAPTTRAPSATGACTWPRMPPPVPGAR